MKTKEVAKTKKKNMWWH